METPAKGGGVKAWVPDFPSLHSLGAAGAFLTDPGTSESGAEGHGQRSSRGPWISPPMGEGEGLLAALHPAVVHTQWEQT